jgi:hypothetical protein
VDRAAVPAPLELPHEAEDRGVPARPHLPHRHDPGDREWALVAGLVRLEHDRPQRVGGARELPGPVRVEAAVEVEQAGRHVVGREARATLERERAPHRRGRAVGARAEDRAGHAQRVVASGDEQGAHQQTSLHAALLQPALVGPDEAADVPQRALRAPGLAKAEHLAQRAELVEVAAEEPPWRVVVGVHDPGLRVKHLGVPRLDQLPPQQLVLGVGDLAVGHPLPGPARHRAVDVREERELPREVAVGGDTRG